MPDRWMAQLQTQHEIVVHLILQSFTGIATRVLIGVLLWGGMQALVDRVGTGKVRHG